MTQVKPKLLLHICCAPDEAYAVDSIRDKYELHCFFCNPNVFPLDEHKLRLDEAKKTARIYDVPFTWDEYDYHSWAEAVKDLTDTPEGGDRCRECFLLRLTRTAETCAAMGWPAFGTVMSVSPHKNVSMLNEAGMKAAANWGVSYVPFDFKKNDGFKKSVALGKQLGLYRQNYCGCELSRDEANKRVSRESNAKKQLF
ncbi:MAG: epoxyqueuosine reductase QueH [Chitinispirillales bacterium]|jgi:predicted adenine nucleotide alpha hydrolase (AANH) superfamily ATPase|nr:epoxyqueuosine reductase QueH [Chitinispirillales bacterium]